MVSKRSSKLVPFSRKSIVVPEAVWSKQAPTKEFPWIINFQNLIGALSCRLRGISADGQDEQFAEVMQAFEPELLSFLRGFEGLEHEFRTGNENPDLLSRIVLNIRRVLPISDAAFDMLQRFDDLLGARATELKRQRTEDITTELA